jgi:CPA2 family monovalent cation:H+ antiporter-2
MGATLIRKWVWQMALNLVLMAGIFIAAAYISREQPKWLLKAPGGEAGRNAFLWFVAMVLSLPLVIATFRKLQAMGLLLAEMSVNEAAAGDRAPSIRAIIAQAIPTAGLVLIGLLVLLLSATILPPLNVLIVLLLVAALIGWMGWRSLVKVYAQAQISLRETLSRPPEREHGHNAAPVHNLLKNAEMKEVKVPAGSELVGKPLRDTALRSRTGASIVAIGRNGESIINPAPEEEIRPGDTLILLGKRESLEAAEALVAGGGKR